MQVKLFRRNGLSSGCVDSAEGRGAHPRRRRRLNWRRFSSWPQPTPARSSVPATPPPMQFARTPLRQAPPWWSVRSAWCSATSAPARSTRCAETFLHGSGMAPTPEHVLGVLSMLFWAVTLTVTIKYVVLIMRADNKGEGGVLALATLRHAGPERQGTPDPPCHHGFGSGRARPVLWRRHHHAGDDSVMSAVEGLSAISTGLHAVRRTAVAGDPGRAVHAAGRAAPPMSAGCSGRSCCCGSWCWACWAHGRS